MPSHRIKYEDKIRDILFKLIMISLLKHQANPNYLRTEYFNFPLNCILSFFSLQKFLLFNYTYIRNIKKTTESAIVSKNMFTFVLSTPPNTIKHNALFEM